jgi:1,4-alpha-glucan branching enzyme
VAAPTESPFHPVPTDEIERLLKVRHSHPHGFLGMHSVGRGKRKRIVCRALLQGVETCEVIDYESVPEKRYPLQKISPEGFFEGEIPERTDLFRYRLRALQHNGEIRQFYDPYAFLPTISEEDLYLFNQGTLHFPYRMLGSHVITQEGIPGVRFAVWAPSAHNVSVVGDFNRWDGRYHPMRPLGASGVWELFIPGLAAGCKYKYEIIGPDHHLRLKSDPYAAFFEPPPHNASIVYDPSGYHWQDSAWLEKRAKTDWTKKPISIYEVHAASWRRVVEDGDRSLTYQEMASELIKYVKDMGFTHVEFMPLAEHPFAGSWGYQVTGFYASTHRFGTPHEFMALVDALHANDIGVIIDWVPGHFPRDSFALAEFDGTHLYEHADPRQGAHMDWGTLIFNYGRHEVKSFLIGNALAWMERFHIDGFRVDAVASMLYLDYSRKDGEWIPNRYGGRENLEAIDFLRETNDLVHKYFPGTITIAEESTAFGGVSKPTSEGGLGFDFKWNMGWMHDTLSYFSRDPLFRRYHHHELTFAMLYQYSENFVSVFSHDEVVHGKGSLLGKMAAGDISAKARELRSLYGYMWFWPGKKTLFMGCEFGQSSEWKYDSSLDWHLLQYDDHEGIRRLVQDLNRVYKSFPSLGAGDLDPAGFGWVNCHDTDASIYSFLRPGPNPEDTFFVVCHLTPVLRETYRFGVPFAGRWEEVINTNATVYGGTGEGNCGLRVTENKPADGQEQSLLLLLPPSSCTVFRYLGA